MSQLRLNVPLKAHIENMEFNLDKPSTGIMVNDSVKIDYTEKDGKLTASRVAKVILKKKEVKPSGAKSASDKK